MYRFNNMRLRGTMKATAYNAEAGTDDLNVVREHKEELAVDEEFEADMDVAQITGGVMLAESAVVSASAQDGPQTTPFAYRDGETPLAFFRPMLTTDADGRLSFSFTVPNANTTWSFNALAFTDKLLTTTASATVLANKPIMVQPNLPRFLRTGDRAVILASVMNNSDSV